MPSETIPIGVGAWVVSGIRQLPAGGCEMISAMAFGASERAARESFNTQQLRQVQRAIDREEGIPKVWAPSELTFTRTLVPS